MASVERIEREIEDKISCVYYNTNQFAEAVEL